MSRALYPCLFAPPRHDTLREMRARPAGRINSCTSLLNSAIPNPSQSAFALPYKDGLLLSKIDNSRGLTTSRSRIQEKVRQMRKCLRNFLGVAEKILTMQAGARAYDGPPEFGQQCPADNLVPPR